MPDERRWGVRLGLLAACGAVAVGGFLVLFPACAAGPFTGMPDLVRQEWLVKVREMPRSGSSRESRPPRWVAGHLPVLIGAAAATLWAWRGRDPARRRLMAGTAGMLWLGAALGAAQFRGLYVAGAFVPLVAGPVLRPRRRAAARARGAAAPPPRRPGPEPGPVRQALASPRRGAAVLAGNGKAFEAEHAAWRSCSDRRAIAALDALPPGIVLAEIDLGPSLLLHSHHSVVAAPYHRALPGLAAAIEAFRDENDLATVAARVGADYIVACAPPAKPGERAASRTVSGAANHPARAGAIPVPDTPYRVWRPLPGLRKAEP